MLPGLACIHFSQSLQCTSQCSICCKHSRLCGGTGLQVTSHERLSAGNLITSDKEIAQLAFSMLASEAGPASSTNTDSQRNHVQQALVAALALHPENSTYVQSLLTVGMAGSCGALPVHDTVQAVKRAGCLHMGIRQVRIFIPAPISSQGRNCKSVCMSSKEEKMK